MKKILSIFLSLIIAFGIFAGIPFTENAFDFLKIEAKAAYEGDLTFTLNYDGESYSVTDCNESATGEIVIPSTYNDLPVTSIGDFAFCDCISLTTVDIPDSVTSIDLYAFYNCTSLVSIKIPDGVTSIDEHVFYNCTSLASIAVPDGITSISSYAFYGCTSLTSITIPDGVTEIGMSAFKNCTSLTSVTIPQTVKVLSWDAFRGCTSLSSVSILASDIEIWGEVFLNTAYYYNSNNWDGDILYIDNHLIDATNSITGSYTVKAGTKTIAADAFFDCNSLRSVIIPEGVTIIGQQAFDNCDYLNSVTLPDSLTYIGNNAFSNTVLYNSFSSDYDTKLFYIDGYLIEAKTTITDEYVIKDTTKGIASNAFYNCSNLTAVVIPDGVKFIGASVFTYCDSLEEVIIPVSVTRIGDSVFDFCDNLENVIYNGTLEQWDCIDISDYNYDLFNNICFKTDVNEIEVFLTFELYQNGYSYIITECDKRIYGEVVIPSTYNGLPIIEIGQSAFEDCDNITEITIPDVISRIGYRAFYNCTGLNYITLPDDSLTYIGKEAFYNTAYYNNSSNWDNSILYINNHLIKANESISQQYSVKNGTKSIASYAFYQCSDLASVTIPDGVTSIGDYAFCGCTNLITISIPDTVTRIGYGAFSNSGIVSNDENWDNGVLYIENVLFDAKDENLGDYVVREGTTSIAAEAFEFCDSLTSITIPDSVTSIGKDAFAYCDNLTSVTIGSGVDDISNGAFYSCDRLKEFIVSENNNAYSSEDGLLLSKDNATLIKYPSSKENVVFTMPDCITSIANNAIEQPINLRLLVLGENVVSFENGAIEVSGAVTLYQNNVKSFIDSGSFALKVYFDGTEENFINCYGVSFGEALGEDFEYGSYEISYGLPVSISENVDYNYIVTKNNEIEIISCKNKVGHVTVPGEIEGLPVTSIGVAAFASFDIIYCLNIVSAENALLRVTLPDSVKHISSHAFAFNPYLRTVDLNEGVESIGAAAFHLCYQLCVQLPDSVKTIGYSALNCCQYVGIGKNVEKVPDGAIRSNYVSIPSTVKGFSEYSIGSLLGLTVYFEGSEEEFNTLVENNCIDFEFDNVDYFEVIYGIPEEMKVNDDFSYFVYNNEIEIIGYNRVNTDVVIPEEIDGKPVKTIGDFAFTGGIEDLFLPLLKTVSIPDTVEKIGRGAFYYNYELEELIIPDSVKYIGAEAITCFCADIIIGSGVECFAPCAVQTQRTIVLPSTVSGFTEGSIYCSKLYYDGTDEQLLSLLEAGYVSFNERELCNTKEFSVSGDYKYIVNGNNEAEILRYLGNEKVVSIPSEIGGLPVISLSNLSFFRAEIDFDYYDLVNAIQVEELTIPDSVTEIGDSFFDVMYTLNTVTANCNSYAAKYITDCGFDSFTFNAIHNTSLDWGVVKEPTCTEPGIKHRGCVNCEKGDNLEISALGHNFSERWTIDVAPTCTEGGLKSRKCNRCDEKCDVTELSALGHDFSTEYTVDIAPDCVTEGSKSYHCSRCDAKASSVSIEPTGHTPGDIWYYSDGYSCDSYGNYRYKLCVYCGEQCETEYINGHVFENGFCEYCDYALFSYEITNNEVTITDYDGEVWDYDYYECDYIGVVIIPEYIEGYPVTAIGDDALNRGYISSVSIPKTVTSIGENALPQYEEWYDDYEPNQCCEIIVDEENPVYCSIDGALFNKAITELIYYPVGLDCDSYNIPDTVTKIHDDALYSYTDCFIIPLSVTYIGGDYLNYDEMGATPPIIAYAGTEEQWNNINVSYDSEHVRFETLGFGKHQVYPGMYLSWGYLSYTIKADNKAYIESICYNIPSSYVDWFGETGLPLEIPAEIDGYPVVSIADYVFCGCSYIYIGQISIPDSVAYIGKNNFTYTKFYDNEANWENGMLYAGNHLIAVDSSFGEVIIKPETITIAKGVLSGGYNISVDDNALNYSTDNGMLFNKDKTVLYYYPMGSDAKIPSSVTRIEDYVFDSGYYGYILYDGTYNQWQTINKGENPGLVDMTVITSDCSIVKIGQQMYYMRGNEVLSAFYGLVKQNSEIYFVQNGVVNESFSGIYYSDGYMYYIESGKVDFNYTGLYYNNGEWLYIAGGIVDNSYTGLAYYQGDYYYVTNGTLDLTYTGLVEYYGGWYYVTNGYLDWSVTTLAEYYGGWYYVENGAINWNYTGLAEYYGGWYYIEGGMINWNYTGLVEYYGGYYHVQNGYLDWNYSGLSYYYGDYYYVTNGAIDWSYTGLTEYYGGWYYVTGGYLDWSVTTLTNYYGGWYYVENGAINWNSNTLVCYYDTWYYALNGMVAWDYTGYVNYYGTNYYITNGFLDWSKQ